MIGDKTLKIIEPERRHLSQHFALVWNRRWQHHIEGRKTIRSHDQQIFANLVNVADLPAAVKPYAGKLGLHQRHKDSVPEKLSCTREFSCTATIFEMPACALVPA